MNIVNKDELCPVCGFNFYAKFNAKPWGKRMPADEICPSCGIQFGYDDTAGGDLKDRSCIYKEWREKWIKGGMKWYSRGMKQPKDWDAKDQLKKIIKTAKWVV
ncbi:hypothetical protein HZB69_04335 [Candidatus Amesbacteria bacterium]|nr:hypothetical protein [Candidatus Amesbacteria bacterium]